MTPLLEAVDLVSGYHGVPVVHGIDLTVDAGEVVALLGPNGAGKSTTLLTLAGDLHPISGEVRCDGRPVREPLHRRARGGMSLVTEERSVIMALTVDENLGLGRGEPARAFELFPELEPHRTRRGGLLSGGQQQILALARALAAEPRLLLADELSFGLAPVIVKRLLAAVRSAADRGVGVLLVEQHARTALEIADRAVVMGRGRIVLDGPSRKLLADIDDIEAEYLGGVRRE